jgi:hypothetical protein
MMRTLIFTFALAFLVPACGGGGGGGASKLKHRFPEKQMASIHPNQRSAEGDAYKAFYIAKMRHDRAQYQLAEIATKLKVAKLKRKSASMEAQAAQEENKWAEKHFMMGMVKVASAASKLAGKSLNSADREIKYLEAQRGFLKKYLPYARENMLAAEAKVELAKALAANQSRIKVPNLKLQDFRKQAKSHASRAAQLKGKADGALRKAKSMRKKSK